MEFSEMTAQGRFDYGAIRRNEFTPRSVEGVRSMKDGEHYTVLREGKILRYDYRTGTQCDLLFDPAAVTPQVQVEAYEFSGDERFLLLTTEKHPIYRRSYTALYWIYDLTQHTLRPLSTQGAQQQALFSPKGDRVAFVRENDLWVVSLDTGEESRITQDGVRNQILNGLPDWVYEEEFAFARAFAWSPDGTRIAWLRFDERRVREYHLPRFQGALYPEDYTFKYPKAGEENSQVALRVYDFASERTVSVEVGTEPDQYLPRLFWTPSGDLGFYRLNRAQNHFEVLLSDAEGRSRVIYEEQDVRYV
ncbi:MAG: DPP IV N-terminal domain-containing protein, partial [Alistipes sp.]|nr:DPP IV N-terminal domain-containing protein [Alistipes sp.]